MEFKDLWASLPPKEENIEIIKKDLSRGIAPHLPYFVTGLASVKEQIENYLRHIDKNFQFCLIKGQYGNGKTNLLKYLEYYFELHTDLKTHCEVWRADVDRFDINLFLLYIIQQSYSTELSNFLRASSKENLDKACNNYNDTFSVLKDYSTRIHENATNPDILAELIKLGTGLKCDKRSFKKFDLDQFSNYNRHEVLVFFLNIFAQNKFYLLFCIDELEKIEEKSRARFQSFLTSFRELIDMGALINGHMLIAAVTDSFASGMPIESYNPAFGRRIKDSIISLENISSSEDILSLGKSLCEILKLKGDSLDALVSSVQKFKFAHTNEVLIKIYKELSQNSGSPENWNEILQKAGLMDDLNMRIKELEDDDVQTRIHFKFFAPLENYLNIISQDNNEYQIKAQEYQMVRKMETHSCYIFLFTNDYESNINRIKNVSQLYPEDQLVIFKPEGLSISHYDLQTNEIANIKDLTIYNPIQLMALITLFVDDYENEDLLKALNNYMKGL